jgi:hypothetical protein
MMHFKRGWAIKFGIYTVYCLAKATQPPVNESDGHKKNLDRDSLVISWVNDVFNPRRILDYFVAIMASLPPDVKVESIWNNTFGRREDACIVRAKRFGKLLLSKVISDDITGKSNFVLEIDTPQLTRVLEKKYHTYYEAMVQNSQSGDIVEMTNK